MRVSTPTTSPPTPPFKKWFTSSAGPTCRQSMLRNMLVQPREYCNKQPKVTHQSTPRGAHRVPVNVGHAGVIEKPSIVPLPRCVDERRGLVPRANDVVLVSGSVGEDDRKPWDASVSKDNPVLLPCLERHLLFRDNIMSLSTQRCLHRVHMPAASARKLRWFCLTRVSTSFLGIVQDHTGHATLSTKEFGATSATTWWDSRPREIKNNG